MNGASAAPKEPEGGMLSIAAERDRLRGEPYSRNSGIKSASENRQNQAISRQESYALYRQVSFSKEETFIPSS